eukprot:CAMPEP_0171188534 /NCGR_PEP_ID=MMETSP0790-20130122/17880_1 /TAXON_ID=2925 /ORGANISM="Alexandrium catenella, Strain OF101" /LENGTH=95 /DNA_ID=CAMNT_0011653617 /DNA_START=292 /DNA_END=577 /DNA_ORIENTATION=-
MPQKTPSRQYAREKVTDGPYSLPKSFSSSQFMSSGMFSIVIRCRPTGGGLRRAGSGDAPLSVAREAPVPGGHAATTPGSARERAATNGSAANGAR